MSGDPPAGSVVALGGKSRGCARNRSITAYTMPPHTPFEASPRGMTPSGGMEMVTTGIPGGKELENRNPEVLGKKPGTLPLCAIANPSLRRSEEHTSEL